MACWRGGFCPLNVTTVAPKEKQARTFCSPFISWKTWRDSPVLQGKNVCPFPFLLFSTLPFCNVSFSFFFLPFLFLSSLDCYSFFLHTFRSFFSSFCHSIFLVLMFFLLLYLFCLVLSVTVISSVWMIFVSMYLCSVSLLSLSLYHCSVSLFFCHCIIVLTSFILSLCHCTASFFLSLYFSSDSLLFLPSVTAPPFLFNCFPLCMAFGLSLMLFLNLAGANVLPYFRTLACCSLQMSLSYSNASYGIF